MGQVIGRSTPKAEEPQSAPITLDHLFATVMHVLLNVPALTAQPDVPRDLASPLVRSQPIAELMRVKGVGEAKAIELKAAFALAARLARTEAEAGANESPGDAARLPV